MTEEQGLELTKKLCDMADKYSELVVRHTNSTMSKQIQKECSWIIDSLEKQIKLIGEWTYNLMPEEPISIYQKNLISLQKDIYMTLHFLKDHIVENR